MECLSAIGSRRDRRNQRGTGIRRTRRLFHHTRRRLHSFLRPIDNFCPGRRRQRRRLLRKHHYFVLAPKPAPGQRNGQSNACHRQNGKAELGTRLDTLEHVQIEIPPERIPRRGPKKGFPLRFRELAKIRKGHLPRFRPRKQVVTFQELVKAFEPVRRALRVVRDLLGPMAKAPLEEHENVEYAVRKYRITQVPEAFVCPHQRIRGTIQHRHPRKHAVKTPSQPLQVAISKRHQESVPPPARTVEAYHFPIDRNLLPERIGKILAEPLQKVLVRRRRVEIRDRLPRPDARLRRGHTRPHHGRTSGVMNMASSFSSSSMLT